MGLLDDKVAFITGAARGQGRAHALALAGDGADIIACDILADLKTTAYPGATPDDLEETVRAVEALGRRCIARRADTRDMASLSSVLEEGVAELGHLDIVVANAGILGTAAPFWLLSDEDWDETISINLVGIWKTIKAATPHLLGREGCSIVLTSSVQGLIAVTNISSYVAAKHGVIGLMRAAASELAPHRIRVNAVCPTTVRTEMIRPNLAFFTDKDDPSWEDGVSEFQRYNLLPEPWVEVEDVANAVAWLVSEKARFVTGVALPVDAGQVIQPPGYPAGTELDLHARPVE